MVVLAAHPDDEIIGAGAHLPLWPNACIVHVTDGSPRSLADAHAAGFHSREAYALARREEAAAALSLAGIEPRQRRCLGFVDQETSLDLRGLVDAIQELLVTHCPDVLMTQPYEGGHPDHDATAFAAHAACCRLARSGARVPLLVEMSSYHNGDGQRVSSHFLPSGACQTEVRLLTPAQQQLKRQQFACFRTQARVLQGFGLEREAFRIAPVCDFTRPPHKGRLYYELFDWGMTGARWRQLAAQASAELGMNTHHFAP